MRLQEVGVFGLMSSLSKSMMTSFPHFEELVHIASTVFFLDHSIENSDSLRHTIIKSNQEASC